MPHPTRFPQPRHAFTLVELSIVLVIIGLLMGGLASLRSYTKNAQLTSVMNESKVLVSAFSQFQTRYTAPPGDYKNASSSWNAAKAATSVDALNDDGDGNGLIRATGAAPGNRAEWFYTFQHLALAGFIQGRYTGATAGGTIGTDYYAKVGTNVQGSSMDKVAFLFDHPSEADGFVTNSTGGLDSLYFNGQYGNILRIAGLNDADTNIPAQPFLIPKQALQIDEKFDDGLPGKGSIVTPIATALPNCASTDVTTTATYATANDSKTCYLFVRMQ